MFHPSSFADPTPLAHADTSRDVLPRGGGRGSRVVYLSDHGLPCHVFETSATKARRVGQRCPLNLSRAETSSRWFCVVVRRGGASTGVVHVT
ncbi:hypothetical protein TNCV_2382971 [Trichonephila clavipes]|nr:hypothetical protein TNCV_2382971 [Trichonephila clavipes]